MTLPFAWTLIAAVAAAIALQPTQALDPATSDAAAVVDRFHGALKSGDLDAAAALLDDKALIFESGGVERSKAEYASHHLPADAAFSKAVPGVITARAGGSAAGFAWVATESRTTGSFNGKPLDRLSTETMVLRQTGSAWKIVHIHWSSAAAKER